MEGFNRDANCALASRGDRVRLRSNDKPTSNSSKRRRLHNDRKNMFPNKLLSSFVPCENTFMKILDLLVVFLVSWFNVIP